MVQELKSDTFIILKYETKNHNLTETHGRLRNTLLQAF